MHIGCNHIKYIKKERKMKTGIIYHSHSGITRCIAEKIQKACGGTLIEVFPEHSYSSLSVVPKGCYRALRGISDPVVPTSVDVSGYDLIVLASPVWAGRSTPVINGAVDTLVGSTGKNVFIVFTCGDEKSGENAIPGMRLRAESKGMELCGTGILGKKQVNDEEAISRLIFQINETGTQS
jgi:flavodoxin